MFITQVIERILYKKITNKQFNSQWFQHNFSFNQNLCESFYLPSPGAVFWPDNLKWPPAANILFLSRILYTLAFKPIFIRGLWRWLSSMTHESSFGGTATPLLSALSRGMGNDTTVIPVHKLLAPLAAFCTLFNLLIGTLHDTEFCRDVEMEDDENMTSEFKNHNTIQQLAIQSSDTSQ